MQGDLPGRATRLARVLGDEFHGYAQITLKALQEVFGLTDVESFKAASPLSGGIARSGQTCGSLLGALLFISSAWSSAGEDLS
ncbi:MAG: C-GCAxxG-C-C family protein [Aigarchaeota archaeon]|nr:C-GCAxxG-C-C family protein [Candidatus Wolframiiraptor gerlachensis]